MYLYMYTYSSIIMMSRHQSCAIINFHWSRFVTFVYLLILSVTFIFFNTLQLTKTFASSNFLILLINFLYSTIPGCCHGERDVMVKKELDDLLSELFNTVM